MRKQRKHDSKDLSDHIVGKTKFIEINATDAPVDNIGWDVQQAEVHSDVQLSEDTGFGGAVIVRAFEFHANPEAFRIHTPTAQELFNSHLMQIEQSLMVDGMKVMTDVAPRVKVSKDKTKYKITVGAEPMKGQTLLERPKTLTQIVNPQ